jgi:imidazolonepropionase-like amidohydrolase
MKTLLKNAELLDGSREFEQADVLTEDGIIRAVGDIGEDADEVVDLSGATLLPAFIDAHVHVAGPDGFAGKALSDWAMNGISSVCDLGMLNESPLADYLSWLAERTDEDHARVLTAGKYIDIPGGYGMGPFPEHVVGIAANTPEGAADAVREEYEAGVGCIKIGLSDVEGPFGPRPSMPPEMLRAIADRAHGYGMLLYAHSFAAATVRTLIECGVDVAAHTPVDLMDDGILNEAAEAGLIFISTIGDPDEPAPPGIPEEVAAKMSAERAVARETMQRNLKAYHDLGGVVALGTDSGVGPAFATDDSVPTRIPIYELRNFISAGFSVPDVVRVATINAAKAMNIDREEGGVEPGKRANLIAVKGRPDESFAALSDVGFVMNRGKILKNTL